MAADAAGGGGEGEQGAGPLPRLEGALGTVYLCGTAHVSQESCEDVRRAMEEVRPHVVFLELCRSRRGMLTQPPPPTAPGDGAEGNGTAAMLEALQRVARGETNPFTAFYSWFLQQAAKMGVSPGEEFRVAYTMAQERNCQVVLGDREYSVTLKRMWHGLHWFDKVRLIMHLLVDGLTLPSEDELKAMVEDLKNTDVLTEAIRELSHGFPWLAKTLIDERDLYLVAGLRQCFFLRQGVREPLRILAVVGAGHIPGITRNWGNHKIDTQALVRVPRPGEAVTSPCYDENDPEMQAELRSARTRDALLIIGVSGLSLALSIGGIYLLLRQRRKRQREGRRDSLFGAAVSTAELLGQTAVTTLSTPVRMVSETLTDLLRNTLGQ